MAIRFLLENLNMPRINIRICGRRQCPPLWHINRAKLDGYLLHYVIHGSGTFVKNGISHNLTAGALFICRPGESATYTASENDPWDYAWVNIICGAEFEALLQDDVIYVPNATKIFSQIASSGNLRAKEWMVSGLLYQLFALLAEEKECPFADQSTLARTVAYIEAHYAEDLHVSQIAESLGLSRSHFCRLFKRQIGLSPQEYIVSYRLEQVEKLLLSSDLTQKEIALRVGYPDVYALSRMFKRRYGIAPGKFRANHQK